jgi:hypothetical protein
MARTAKHLSEPSLFVDDWQPQISSTKSRGERHCDVSRQRTCRTYHNGLKIGDGQWRKGRMLDDSHLERQGGGDMFRSVTMVRTGGGSDRLIPMVRTSPGSIHIDR